MPDERGHLLLVESGGFVLATYREIAAHFRLGGPNAARTKVKRAGWIAEPTNHPADPLRIRVPRDVWSQAAEIPSLKRAARPDHNTDRDSGSRPSDTPTDKRGEISPLGKRDGASHMAGTRHLNALEGHVNTLREDVATERAARIAAERQRDQAVADLRLEREQRAAEAARREAELDQARADFRAERSRVDGLRDQLEVMRVQLATSEAVAKAAHDMARVSGEQQSVAERRADAETARAAQEREDLLNAAGRTRRELETVRERVAEAEAHQDRLRAEVDSVRAELSAVRRTEDERKSRGRWTRLLAAWRGG
jgi:hypothetical protein